MSNNVSIKVNVFNHTGKDLILKKAHLDHGKWCDKPESVIEDGKDGDFMVVNGKCGLIDVKVSWHHRKSDDSFIISIIKPTEGVTKFSVDSPECFRFTISGDPLEDNARVDVSFYRL